MPALPAPHCFLSSLEQSLLRAYNVQALDPFAQASFMHPEDFQLEPQEGIYSPSYSAQARFVPPPDTLEPSHNILDLARLHSGVIDRLSDEVSKLTRESTEQTSEKAQRLRAFLAGEREKGARLQGEVEKASREKAELEQELLRKRQEEAALRASAEEMRQRQPAMPMAPQMGQPAQPVQPAQATLPAQPPMVSAAVSQFADALLKGQFGEPLSQGSQAPGGAALYSTANTSGFLQTAQTSQTVPTAQVPLPTQPVPDSGKELDRLLSSQGAREYAYELEAAIQRYAAPAAPAPEGSFYPKPNEQLQTSPPFDQLTRYPYQELSRVRDFSVSNEYGKIEWPGLLDLRGKDLGQIKIQQGGFDLGNFYPDRSAIIYLYNMAPEASQSFETFRAQLEQACADHGRLRVLDCRAESTTVILRSG